MGNKQMAEVPTPLSPTPSSSSILSSPISKRTRKRHITNPPRTIEPKKIIVPKPEIASSSSESSSDEEEEETELNPTTEPSGHNEIKLERVNDGISNDVPGSSSMKVEDKTCKLCFDPMIYKRSGKLQLCRYCFHFNKENRVCLSCNQKTVHFQKNRCKKCYDIWCKESQKNLTTPNTTGLDVSHNSTISIYRCERKRRRLRNGNRPEIQGNRSGKQGNRPEKQGNRPGKQGNCLEKRGNRPEKQEHHSENSKNHSNSYNQSIGQELIEVLNSTFDEPVEIFDEQSIEQLYYILTEILDENDEKRGNSSGNDANVPNDKEDNVPDEEENNVPDDLLGNDDDIEILNDEQLKSLEKELLNDELPDSTQNPKSMENQDASSNLSSELMSEMFLNPTTVKTHKQAKKPPLLDSTQKSKKSVESKISTTQPIELIQCIDCMDFFEPKKSTKTTNSHQFQQNRCKSCVEQMRSLLFVKKLEKNVEKGNSTEPSRTNDDSIEIIELDLSTPLARQTTTGLSKTSCLKKLEKNVASTNTTRPLNSTPLINQNTTRPSNSLGSQNTTRPSNSTSLTNQNTTRPSNSLGSQNTTRPLNSTPLTNQNTTRPSNSLTNRYATRPLNSTPLTSQNTTRPSKLKTKLESIQSNSGMKLEISQGKRFQQRSLNRKSSSLISHEQIEYVTLSSGDEETY